VQTELRGGLHLAVFQGVFDGDQFPGAEDLRDRGSGGWGGLGLNSLRKVSRHSSEAKPQGLKPASFWGCYGTHSTRRLDDASLRAG
jgi:hypothetical protein